MKWETSAWTPSGYKSFERVAEQMDYEISHRFPMLELLDGILVGATILTILRKPEFAAKLPESLNRALSLLVYE